MNSVLLLSGTLWCAVCAVVWVGWKCAQRMDGHDQRLGRLQADMQTVVEVQRGLLTQVGT